MLMTLLLPNNRAPSTMVATDSHYRTYLRWANETTHKPTKLLKEMSAKELNDTLTYFVLEIRYVKILIFHGFLIINRQEKDAGKEYAKNSLLSLQDGLFRFVNDDRRAKGEDLW